MVKGKHLVYYILRRNYEWKVIEKSGELQNIQVTNNKTTETKTIPTVETCNGS